MDRTERQKLGIKRWLNTGGCASCVFPTGFGKTRVALDIIDLLVEKNPDIFILIVVPTEILKEQWLEKVIERNRLGNCQIEIINSVIKKQWECDLLIEDEVHLFASPSFSTIFNVVKYKLILCLTGTLERLDGKEELIKKYAPVCDKITMDEAVKNGWVSPFTEYVVMIKTDLTEYNELNKRFNAYFSYFGWDFQTAMKSVQDVFFRRKWCKENNLNFKEATAMTYDWMRCLRLRKQFVQSHPKKIEIARKIINARKDKKILIFSATIADAEKIGTGLVLHSKQSKKLNEKILEEFKQMKSGVINSSKALVTGCDIEGLDTEIILSINSSKITKTQSVGRAIRFSPGKKAEIFTLIIAGTQEFGWWRNSKTSSNYVIIDEEQLDDILTGNKIQSRKIDDNSNINFRF